jgi:DNA polymerase III subunit chi
MTAPEVIFHDAGSGGGDVVAVAVTLVRWAHRERATALILAADAIQAQTLDARLWETAEDEFIAHALADDADVAAAEVVIAAPDQPPPPRSWVINLRNELVALPCRCVLELIPADESGKAAARQRWRAYQGRGLTPVKRALPMP